MSFESKKTLLLILGITAILFSRVMFVFFNDPEGPNVPVVVAASAIVYVLSLIAFFLYPASPTHTPLKRLLLTVLVQVLIVTGLYFCLN